MALLLPFPVPPALALARSTDVLRPGGLAEPVWEAKWDGFRAAYAAGGLWSRRGTDLARFFPDLMPVLAARLPADIVVDGEVVAWDIAAGRLDFASLTRRLTAGRRLSAVASARPAQLVCFDLLALGGRDLRGWPLAQRRAELERLLSGLGAPIALCQQTADPATAAHWLQTLSAGGIEGLVIKDRHGRYPTVAGQRVWHKLRVRTSVDLVATAVIGDPAAPTALLLARPSPAGLVHVGATTRVTRAVAHDLARLLHPTGEHVTRTNPWGDGHSVEATVITPLVVEVGADVAVDGQTLRHPARFVRARPDLTIADVTDVTEP